MRHHGPMPSGNQPLSSKVLEEDEAIHDASPATTADDSSQAANATAGVGRFLPSGDEAGTPPEDRPFRADILGLRAVAVLLVVLVHAQVRFLWGGFIGVDVFFVISGFVITGLLLRERSVTGRTNILAFYGRRARRIVPAAMLVIVVTVLAERVLIGAHAADFAAAEARWASVFLANFPLVHNNFFHPMPTPLGAYWSLAVEEQFYLVYPILLLLAAVIARHRSLRFKLGILLGIVVLGSFTWSVVTSRGAGTVSAYASPFTHAWELAVGALLAVCGDWFKRLPLTLAAVITWVGLGTVVLSAVIINGPGYYPGYIAAMPVSATALIIAGGTSAPRWGAEVLLRLAPLKWLGLWSFSIYLWQFPILTVAEQRWGHTTVTTNLLLAGAAVVLAAGTYFAIENPIRHSSLLTGSPVLSVVGGASLIVVCVIIVTFAI